MNSQKIRRVFLCCTAAMLILSITEIVPLAHSAQVTSIRHGIHVDFERVVFDVSGITEYQVDTVSLNGKLQVNIQGVQPQDSPPVLALSNRTNLVLGIDQTTPGRFEISTLSPVKANSFTISGDTYRIVVDLYSQTAEVVVRKPVTQKPPTVIQTPTQTAPQSGDLLTSENVIKHQNNKNPENEDELLYDFSGLYKLKQSALRCQTIGELDSAGMFWVEYIETAHKLKTNLTGNSEFALANWEDESSISNEAANSAKIYSNILLFPVTVLIVLGILFVLLRRKLHALLKRLLKKKWENLVEDNQSKEASAELEETTTLKQDTQELVDDELAKQPQKEQIEEKSIEDEIQDESEAEKTTSEENIDIPAEQSVEEKTKEDVETSSEDGEDTALDELMDFSVDEIEETIDDEPTEEDERVQRILELAGEERSIAEIAEEMGIGEDEVRLVLDLQ